MKIAVVGCGAVGSIFAAHLASVGVTDGPEVWVYDRDREHIEAIDRDGLRLTGVADVTGRPRATANPADLPPCDFGIVATKAWHTEAAITETAHAFAYGAVCSVQNGLGNEEILARHVERVIRGTTFPAGRVVGPGVVEWDTAGKTWIGPFEPAPADYDNDVTQLADALNRSGMETLAMEDARGAQWAKLIFNAATNPVGALAGLTHGQICERPGLRKLVSDLITEAKAVATAQDIRLDSDPEAVVDRAAKTAYHHRASMLQDVLAGRRTEVDYLNGGIVRAGETNGVATPLHNAIWALVRTREQGVRFG